MIDPPSPDVHLHPPRAGVGWPYALLMLGGAGICFYLAVDLYLVFAGYARTPPSDYLFVAALAGVGGLFLAAAWGVWFFPWSWARMSVGERGLTVSVRGLGAFPSTHLTWEELSTITIVILPRHASTLRFRTREGLTKTLRTAALSQGVDDVLKVLEQGAKGAGYRLAGAPVKAPVLGLREWAVEAQAD